MADEVPHIEKEKQTAIVGSIGVLRVFGVPIRLHFTFILLLIFLISIGLGQQQSGWMIVLYVLALFASVLLHELGHAMVALRYGIRTLEIVMFPIGGLSRFERLPKAREELWIALAGPMVNLLIGCAIGAWQIRQNGFVPIGQLLEPTDANLAQRIAVGNLFLAAFNLLPAYPMDGGRVLRAFLALSRPQEEATQIAARAGQWLSAGMGLYGLLSANFMLVFIALFVYLGAVQEGAAARGRTLTMGFPVRAAMITDFRTLSHGDSIRDAGNLLLSTSQQDFPVMHGEQVIGLLTRSALMRGMLTAGPDGYVAGSMDRDFIRLAPELDLSEAMTQMGSGSSCALVMDGERLLGLMTSENLSEFILLRQVSLAQSKAEAEAHKGSHSGLW
jgi:Zn-dependent protease/CBS domain-containing protein